MRMFGYAHLPGVKAQVQENYPLAIGQLCHISFDDWQKLDGAFRKEPDDTIGNALYEAFGKKLDDGFNDFHDRYEKSKPLFFVVQTETGDYPFESGVAYLKDIVTNLGWAFTLQAPHVPLSNMSCQYYGALLPDGLMVKRYIGGFEREWIVFGDHYQFDFSPDLLVEVNKTFDFLCRSRFENCYLIMNGLRTLAFTSNPEFCFKWNKLSYFTGFVYWVSVLESTLISMSLNKVKNLTITDAFGKALAVIIADSFEEINELYSYCCETYRVRSKIMHGQGHSDNFTSRVNEMFKRTRYIVCSVLKSLIALNNIDFKIEALPEMLFYAFEDRDLFLSLHDKIKTGYRYE